IIVPIGKEVEVGRRRPLAGQGSGPGGKGMQPPLHVRHLEADSPFGVDDPMLLEETVDPLNAWEVVLSQIDENGQGLSEAGKALQNAAVDPAAGNLFEPLVVSLDQVGGIDQAILRGKDFDAETGGPT